MKLFSPKHKKLLIFQKELTKPEKQTKKSSLRIFLIFLLHNIKNLYPGMIKAVFSLSNIKNG